ncbi:MAG: spore coat U domain-containing protein [Deltaproteobacteria bacterium]|nr:spore coat U domain-containing protein [Deltaproteobacteria bacterium]
MRMIRRALGAAILLASPLAPIAHAGTDTANLGVSATVSANCTIATTALAFGEYDPVDVNAASGLDGTGTVSVTCTFGADVVIELDEGANEDTGSQPDAPLRRLTDGSDNYLSYALHSDAGRTAVWATGAAADVPHTGTGAQVPFTVYGRIAAGQNVPEGNYTDTVMATVTF